MNATYPLLEIIDERTAEPVCIVVWHIRAIYRVNLADHPVTRIEYVNGEAIDTAEETSQLVERFYQAALH